MSTGMSKQKATKYMTQNQVQIFSVIKFHSLPLSSLYHSMYLILFTVFQPENLSQGSILDFEFGGGGGGKLQTKMR